MPVRFLGAIAARLRKREEKGVRAADGLVNVRTNIGNFSDLKVCFKGNGVNVGGGGLVGGQSGLTRAERGRGRVKPL